MYAPRTTKIPWAMLMICMTPKIRVRPAAIKAYTPPVRIPSTTALEISVPTEPPPRTDGAGGRNGPSTPSTHDFCLPRLGAVAVLSLVRSGYQGAFGNSIGVVAGGIGTKAPDESGW